MRDKTQLVELDLRSGILTNESPYAIGPRMRQAYNTVWDYRYPRSTPIGSDLMTGPWVMRQPLTFPIVAPMLYAGALSFRDIAFTANGGLPVAGNGVLLLGCNASNQYTAWGTDGQVLPFFAGVPRFTVSNANRMLGCSTWWQTPGFDPTGGAALSEGITVFSHPLGSQVYYLLDSGSDIRSLTATVANCHAGASALAVHLDRVWMIGGTDKTSLRFTDPFDVHTINPNSEIIIAGAGRCLIPGQLGTVDSTGVPHLVIGHTNGVQVLDGDPNLGNAALRTLGEGIGMQSSHVAAVTPYGVYFIGTDMDLYQIPLGMQEVRPVGGPIRDRIGINNIVGSLDIERASLVWFNPYLYLYPGGETAHAYVLEPNRDGIAKAWGPVTLNSTINARPAVVRAPTANLPLHAPSGIAVPSVHSIDSDPSGTAARYLAFDQRTTAAQHLQARTGGIVTGLMHLPGHAIQPMRVLLETVRQPKVASTTVTWAVTITDERGINSPGVRVPEPVPPPWAAVTTGLPEPIITQHFVFPATLPAARGISVSIFAIPGSDLGLVRAFLEVKASPLQF